MSTDNPNIRQNVADEGEQREKTFNLEQVDDDYDEWVVCEPVDAWEKNGMQVEVECKKWYRRDANNDDAEEELMTKSYIGVIYGPDTLNDVSAERINEVLDIDQPNGVVKRGSNLGFDSLHKQLVEGEDPEPQDVKDSVNWVCEQLYMLL